MPELPEVETTVRLLRPRLLHARITGFRSRWARHVTPAVATVRRAIVGRTVREVSRRAKFAVLHLDDGTHLLVHLRMSGRLEWLETNGTPYDQNSRRAILPTNGRTPMGSHVRAWWDFESGDRLLFRDARKFGRIFYTRDLATFTAKLGIEPLADEFTLARLAELLRGRARLLKPLLLDQSVIAGLGNIYTDEALFAAGIHPLARANRLSKRQITALHGAIQTVLRRGIERNGASIDWVYQGGTMQDVLAVYGRGGEPCVCCNACIVRMVVGQRGTHVCPQCQPRASRPGLPGRQ